MTKADFSRITGIPFPNVCRMERGKTLPRLDVLFRVAAALDVPVARLLEV